MTRTKKGKKEDQYWEVDEVVARRRNHLNDQIEYLVRWKGYNSKTWEPSQNLTPDLLESLKGKFSGKYDYIQFEKYRSPRKQKRRSEFNQTPGPASTFAQSNICPHYSELIGEEAAIDPNSSVIPSTSTSDQTQASSSTSLDQSNEECSGVIVKNVSININSPIRRDLLQEYRADGKVVTTRSWMSSVPRCQDESEEEPDADVGEIKDPEYNPGSTKKNVRRSSRSRVPSKRFADSPDPEQPQPAEVIPEPKLKGRSKKKKKEDVKEQEDTVVSSNATASVGPETSLFHGKETQMNEIFKEMDQPIISIEDIPIFEEEMMIDQQNAEIGNEVELELSQTSDGNLAEKIMNMDEPDLVPLTVRSSVKPVPEPSPAKPVTLPVEAVVKTELIKLNKNNSVGMLKLKPSKTPNKPLDLGENLRIIMAKQRADPRMAANPMRKKIIDKSTPSDKLKRLREEMRQARTKTIELEKQVQEKQESVCENVAVAQSETVDEWTDDWDNPKPVVTEPVKTPAPVKAAPVKVAPAKPTPKAKEKASTTVGRRGKKEKTSVKKPKLIPIPTLSSTFGSFKIPKKTAEKTVKEPSDNLEDLWGEPVSETPFGTTNNTNATVTSADDGWD